jgi:AraC-like DNA-binding protein
MSQPTNAGEPLCAVETLDPLVSALRAWDAPVGEILARVGLCEKDLDDKTLRIPQSKFESAWFAAREITEDPAIGLHVIDHFDVNRLDLVAYLAAASATPREAYARARRYTRIAHDALEVDLSVENGRSICRTRFRGRENDRTLAEFAVGLIVKVSPRVVGREVEINAWFEHSEPDYADEYEPILRCPVRFDAPLNGIVGGAAGIDDPLPHADPGLVALLEEHAAEQLSKIPAVSTFPDRVRERIAAVLPEGDVSPERVARSLGVSSRTMRRRLGEGGVSYQQLLDDVRRDLATRALARPEMSISEVALLLGFSDASAFNKAFRRWTGKRPSDLR